MKNKKYIIAGGILILIFGGILIAQKAKAASVSPKKRKGSVEVGSLEGEFVTPAEVRTQQGTRLRADSNTNSKILVTYNRNVRLIVTGDKKEKDGTWYRVNDESGRAGWVREDVVDVMIDTPNPFVDDTKTLDQQLAEWELYNV